VREALHTVQMDALADRMPTQLSGGQQQRVGLARALVNDPLVLLLDEPLGALDLKLRKEMQIELKRIQREVGISFVYVTHDQEEAMTMSDRIAVMSAGRVEQLGTPREIYFHPTTRFVADFIGTANLLPATLVRAGERPQVRIGEVVADAGSIGSLPGREVIEGDPVSLMVRPETLRVVRERPEGRVALPVVVSEVIFQGTGIRLDLLGPGEAPIVALVPADASDWRPGDRAHVQWDADRAHVVVEPAS
jgi:spermidine/putrescine transport system ATP-binding protein